MTELSEDEARIVATFDNAPLLAESLRMRVACALWAADGGVWHEHYLRTADTAIDAMKGSDR